MLSRLNELNIIYYEKMAINKVYKWRLIQFFFNVLNQNLVRDIGYLFHFFSVLIFLFNQLRNHEKIEQAFKDEYLLIT